MGLRRVVLIPLPNGDIPGVVGDVAASCISWGFGVCVNQTRTGAWSIYLIHERTGRVAAGIRAGLHVLIQPQQGAILAVVQPGTWRSRRLGQRLWAALLWPALARGVWARVRMSGIDDMVIRIMGDCAARVKRTEPDLRARFLPS